MILLAVEMEGIIFQGSGADEVIGGFGHNTFDSERDGWIDYLYFKSDQFAYNWLYDSSGNNPEGSIVDIIKGLDQADRVCVQGVGTSELSFSQVNDFAAPTGTFSGIGIFANEFLEGIYTGDNLNITIEVDDSWYRRLMQSCRDA